MDYYLGKRLAYIYKAKTERKGSKYRVVWGKVGSKGGADWLPLLCRGVHRRCLFWLPCILQKNFVGAVARP